MVKVLETLDDFKAAIAGEDGNLVVVDFFATWCPPCVAIGPEFVALSEDSDNANGK